MMITSTVMTPSFIWTFTPLEGDLMPSSSASSAPALFTREATPSISFTAARTIDTRTSSEMLMLPFSSLQVM